MLFASNSLTGNTYYLDNLRIAKHVADPTYSAATTFEDYESTHNLAYLSSDGAYLPTVANPSATGVNTSAHVAKYTRKATADYDVLSFSTSSIKDGTSYINGTKVLAMDVYTTAPAGTLISWQLESSALDGNPYPNGRHSIYQAAVKQSNTWQTLYFTYSSTPDASTTDASVDRVVLLFAPHTGTSDVYYLDNLRSLNATSATNAAPTVSLTAPAANAAYTAPASITLTANAADSDGTVSKVDFYQGTTLLGTATASPYSYTWTGVAAGTYSITAKATDNAGAVTTSSAVSVTVGAASTATNLALNKPTYTSSTENSGTPGSAAVDGDATTTRWSSAFADPLMTGPASPAPAATCGCTALPAALSTATRSTSWKCTAPLLAAARAPAALARARWLTAITRTRFRPPTAQ